VSKSEQLKLSLGEDIMLEPAKILIVDDRPENLIALEGLLESRDLAIYKAVSGNEALGMVLEHDFALVLLDVQMPELDGFQTAELMRGSEQTRHTPIIFVTAINKEQRHIFKGYEAGAVDYLFKPIDTDILKSKVRIFCDLYRQKARVMQLQSELAARVKELEYALTRVKQLEGLIPICSYCKKVRNGQQLWEQIENYIMEHSEARFSHGICPNCYEKIIVPQLAARGEKAE
jgi:CheY-like chemotaxis protein